MRIRIRIRGLTRHWLTIIVIMLAILVTVERAASQEATPTPDVNTVPRPEDIFTPTNTPLPPAVPIVTATPVNQPAAQPSDTQSNSNSTASTNNALPTNPAPPAPANLPGATPVAPVAPGVDSPPILVQAPGSPLAMTVQLDRAYVWPGQQFTVVVVLANRGAQPLTDLRLRYDLPIEITLQSAATTDTGSVQPGPPSNGITPLLIYWPSVDAGREVQATLTFAIAPQTAKGRLLDTQLVVSASQYADMTTEMTLAMPPAQLPQF